MISITRGNCNALPLITIVCGLLLWSHAITTTTTTAILVTATTTRTKAMPSLTASAARDAEFMANAKIIEHAAAAYEVATNNITHATALSLATDEFNAMATREQQQQQRGVSIGNAEHQPMNISQTSMAVTAGAAVGATVTATATTRPLNDEAMSYHQYCLEHRNTFFPLFTLILYSVVCIVGLFGNTLVIYVVLRFSKMQTVTNIYILNLAIADECFLIGIPFLLSTMRICSWKFGDFLCKAYMVNTSIPQFTSSIFLLIMSADRYIAVCHPIASPRYRTLRIAKLVTVLAWCTSAVLMLPVILYASTVVQEDGVNLSCNIDWPESYERQSAPTFILYSFLLGFATPLTFILVFYFLVIRKLQAVGVKHKSKEKKRSHRKVTRLVLTVITVYILCWLPYWISQVALISTTPDQLHLSKDSQIIIFLLFGCLSYSNSAMNPILYAFLSDNFRKSFSKAFACITHHEVNAQLHAEPSVLTRQGSRKRHQGIGGGGKGVAGGARGAGGTKRGVCDGDDDGVVDGCTGITGALICGQVNAKLKQQHQQQQHKSQHHQQQHSDQHASSCSGGNNNSSSTTTTTSSTATGTVGSSTDKTNITTAATTLLTNLTSGTDSSSSSDSCTNSSPQNNGHQFVSTSRSASPPHQQEQRQLHEDTMLMLQNEQTICTIMERHHAPIATDPMSQTDL